MNRAEERVLNYLNARAAERGGDPLSLEMPLLSSGLLDSLLLMDLVAFAEREFDIAVPDEELVPDNFETPLRVAALIDRLYGQS